MRLVPRSIRTKDDSLAHTAPQGVVCCCGAILLLTGAHVNQSFLPEYCQALPELKPRVLRHLRVASITFAFRTIETGPQKRKRPDKGPAASSFSRTYARFFCCRNLANKEGILVCRREIVRQDPDKDHAKGDHESLPPAVQKRVIAMGMRVAMVMLKCVVVCAHCLSPQEKISLHHFT